MLGHHNSETDFHICTGKNPIENILQTITQLKFVKNHTGLHFLTQKTLVLLVSAMIKYFQNRDEFKGSKSMSEP